MLVQHALWTSPPSPTFSTPCKFYRQSLLQPGVVITSMVGRYYRYPCLN